MAWTDDIIVRRDAIAAELAAGQTPNGQSFRKPTIQIDGENVDTVGYVTSLGDQLKQLNDLLKDAGVSPTGDGATATCFEQITVGST